MLLPLTLVAACVAAVALAWPPVAARADHAVDANLVTALDASDSVMRHEEWILLDGMARAISHPAFLAAVRAGRHRRVGFAAFAWSSHGDLRPVVPWAVLGSEADVERIARTLAKAPRRGDESFGGDHDRSEAPPSPERMTDISEAVRHGVGLLAAAPHGSERPVLNVCGNGSDNVGEGPERARDLAVGAGVTVNGLVIGEEPGLAAYYRERVAGGPGSFVVEARKPADVADAMLRKLVLDLLSSDGARGGHEITLAGSGGEARP